MNLFQRDPLDDPSVEWEIYERTAFTGATEWVWKVRVGDKSQQNTAYFKPDAVERAQGAARRMLGEGEHLIKTRPCALCGKPSRVGEETDTDQCADLLAKARAELADLPIVEV